MIYLVTPEREKVCISIKARDLISPMLKPSDDIIPLRLEMYIDESVRCAPGAPQSPRRVRVRVFPVVVSTGSLKPNLHPLPQRKLNKERGVVHQALARQSTVATSYLTD